MFQIRRSFGGCRLRRCFDNPSTAPGQMRCRLAFIRSVALTSPERFSAPPCQSPAGFGAAASGAPHRLGRAPKIGSDARRLPVTEPRSFFWLPATEPRRFFGPPPTEPPIVGGEPRRLEPTFGCLPLIEPRSCFGRQRRSPEGFWAALDRAPKVFWPPTSELPTLGHDSQR